MKTYFILFFLCFTSLISIAQDTTKPFYFPHKTGDRWEYFFDDYSPYYIDTLQNYTVSNSQDTQGQIIFKQYAEFIHPKERAVLLNRDTTKYWIDTTNNYVYGYSTEYDSALIYKLNAKKGEQWVIKDNSKYSMARIVKKWNGLLFGKATTFMAIRYYLALNSSSDTTGYDRYSDIIADGFGLIARGGGETLGEIHLIGAIINGYQYGNFTVVSIKKSQKPIPSEIRLFQNYPNPFNPSTTISFELPSSTNISLVIYNVLGKEIKRIIDSEPYSIGVHKVIWNGTDSNGKKVASGIYFYRLLLKEQVITKSMLLLK
jgi:hypothetical protein